MPSSPETPAAVPNSTPFPRSEAAASPEPKLPGDPTATRPLRAARADDNIAGPLSDELSGVTLRYTLSTGGSQVVSFGVDEVTLASSDPNGTAQAPVAGIYRARRLRTGIYLVHWLDAARSAHVGMVIDLPAKRVDIGAKLAGAVELFEQGTIEAQSGTSAAGNATPAAPDALTASAARSDLVGGPVTDELTGITLAYAYAKSGVFRISYGPGTVSFGMPAKVTDAPSAMLTVPARMRKLRDDLYMVHWFSPDPARTVHCVQIVDFAQMMVFLAAVMPPRATEDFDLAEIGMITGR